MVSASKQRFGINRISLKSQRQSVPKCSLDPEKYHHLKTASISTVPSSTSPLSTQHDTALQPQTGTQPPLTSSWTHEQKLMFIILNTPHEEVRTGPEISITLIIEYWIRLHLPVPDHFNSSHTSLHRQQ